MNLTIQNLFRQSIILPPILTLQSSDDGARVLAEHVRVSDMCNFIAQNKEDNKTLLALSKQHRLRMEVSHFSDSKQNEKNLNYWLQERIDPKKYGFKSVLIDELQDEEVVLSFLCRTSKVHQAPYLSSPLVTGFPLFLFLFRV